MSTKWPLVKLGEVLSQHTEYIDAPEPREYLKLSVKVYGKGVVLDTPANGATLKMMRHQIAKAGQVFSPRFGEKRVQLVLFLLKEKVHFAQATSFFLIFLPANSIGDGYKQYSMPTIFKSSLMQRQRVQLVTLLFDPRRC